MVIPCLIGAVGEELYYSMDFLFEFDTETEMIEVCY